MNIMVNFTLMECFILRSPQFVAHAPYGLDVFAFFPHFAAQLLYMGVYGAGISKIVIIPHIIKNLFPGKGDSLIFHKVGEKLKLLKAQVNLLSVNGD